MKWATAWQQTGWVWSPACIWECGWVRAAGCPLLFRVLEGACGVMGRGMATFAQAAIQDDYLDEIRAGDSFTVDKP